MKKSTWIIIGIVVILVIWGIAGYNRFVGLTTAADNAWAQVETQYQRRFDLIPNLVASVQGQLTQEQKVFGDIAEARTRYSGATTVPEKVAAANEVESALSRLLVIIENYPQLTSGATVQNLMTEIEGTENRIAVERKRFNDSVAALNVAVRRFPSVILAGIFGFDGRPYFEATEGAEAPPQVDLVQ